VVGCGLEGVVLVTGAKVRPPHRPPTARASEFCGTLLRALACSIQWNDVAEAPRSKPAGGRSASSNGVSSICNDPSGMVCQRNAASRGSGSIAQRGRSERQQPPRGQPCPNPDLEDLGPRTKTTSTD
jgi:hypothetical protein